MNIFYRPVFRPESPPIVPFFDRVVLLKKNSRSKPVGPWSLGRQMVPWRSSCLDRPLELSFILYRSLPMVVRSVDGHPALTRSSDDQDFSFSTCLTTVADHFFGTRPSEDWGNRARSSPRRYRVVLDSDRRFPTIFAKKCGRSTKTRIGYYRDQNNPWWDGRFTEGSVKLLRNKHINNNLCSCKVIVLLENWYSYIPRKVVILPYAKSETTLHSKKTAISPQNITEILVWFKHNK